MAKRATVVMEPESLLCSLAARRPLFHSEADFQHALAWEIQTQVAGARVRLEIPIGGMAERGAVDILVHHKGRTIGFELKYLKNRLIHEHEGESFNLPTTGANDLARYDVCKDLLRLEHMVGSEQIHAGYVIALSNDPKLWRKETRAGSIDESFKLTEGRFLSGELAWSVRAGAGTTKGRESVLRLAGSYPLSWSEYSELDAKNGRFRVLVVPVTSGFAFETAPIASAPLPRVVQETIPKDDGRARLRRFFRELTAPEITMPFDEIEEFLGPLPPSASNHNAWWSHVGSHTHAVWEHEGFVASPNLLAKRVLFRRR